MLADYLKYFNVSDARELTNSEQFKKYVNKVEVINNTKVINFFFSDGFLYFTLNSSIVKIGITNIGLTMVSESLIYNINQ